MPIIGVETYQDKNFIVVWCPGGETRPYSSPKTMANDNKERIHYIRKASNTVEPTDDEEKDLFNLANRVPFDDRVNHQAEMSDLNITLIQNYLKEIKSSLYEKSKTGDFIEVCQDMNIVSTLPEYIKPKNVGLMFFSMEPDKFFPYTQIDVVQFPSGLGGDDIIEKTFKGPIQQQLRDALQYIRNVVITEKVIKHPDRAEADRFFNFPYAAIEEALSNAVYHRAYDEREPIEVRVESDRIEIVSFPGPDRSVTMEGLKSYRVSNRRYRNRRIGDFLKELHLTEGRNTGFKKILDALEANGSPKPEFETDDDRSYFITRLFVHEEFTKALNERNMSEVSNQNERSLSEVLSGVLKQSDFCKVEKIIKLIEEKGEITPKEAEAVSGKSAATVRRYLKMLVGTGYVQTEGNTNNSVYKVRL
jgi:ATP-dependent DNA helicase RecG